MPHPHNRDYEELSRSAPTRLCFSARTPFTSPRAQRRASTPSPLNLIKPTIGFDPEGQRPPTPNTSPTKQAFTPVTPHHDPLSGSLSSDGDNGDISAPTTPNILAALKQKFADIMGQSNTTDQEAKFAAAVLAYNQRQRKRAQKRLPVMHDADRTSLHNVVPTWMTPEEEATALRRLEEIIGEQL